MGKDESASAIIPTVVAGDSGKVLSVSVKARRPTLSPSLNMSRVSVDERNVWQPWILIAYFVLPDVVSAEDKR